MSKQSFNTVQLMHSDETDLMTVERADTFKHVQMPQGFRFESEDYGGRGDNWLKRFTNPDTGDDVKLCQRFSGSPLSEVDAESFRSVLLQKPHVIFEKSDSHNEALLRTICYALGNVGDNQMTNSTPAPYGPTFELEKMAVEAVGDRNVIRVWGWFHGADMVPDHYFTGIFVDAQPESEECCVEELYLEASSEELYNNHLPLFDAMIEKITWPQ
ncbi:MAG: hypothetical protein K2X93_28805 [Candidatus Obscuribacterales bacterium]|nr:hypothetical protein [Candidatus Obscuribacterales bacterium]